MRHVENGVTLFIKIVLTENGHPYILLQGISDSRAAESASWGSSPAFRDMIRQRRQEQAIRWEEAKQQLGVE